MNNKVAIGIAVAVAAVVIIGGAAFFMMGTGNGDNDTVVYNGNGGIYDNKESFDGKAGQVMDNIFTKDGYTFIIWNDKQDGTGTNYDVEDEVKGGTTLYAQWKETRPGLFFTSNLSRDAHIGIYLANYLNPENIVDLNSTFYAEIPDNPAIMVMPKSGFTPYTVMLDSDDRGYISFDDRGYSFKLSFTGATYQAVKTSSGIGYKLNVTGSIVTVTMSEVTSKMVSYHANNGTTDHQSVESNEAKAIGDLGYTYAGHTFVKWNTKADGTGTDFAVGDELPYAIRLYAIWTP